MQGQESQRFALIDALAEEFAARLRRGERPALDEYVERYPELADDIRELLPALAEVEGVKAEFRAAVTSRPTAAPALDQVGDYRIIREVGQGGMGVVYEAEQVSLGRRVALKLLPTKALLPSAKARQRFEREAKAAAKLHHTNIVPVFGVGEHDGMPYFVMQFIQGLGLDDVLDELKRLQGADCMASAALPAQRIGGTPRVDVTAADMAHSLMTGSFAQPDAPMALEVVDTHHPRPLSGEGRGEKCSGETAATSSSSVVLPGQSDVPGASQPRARTYWHSVARVGIEVAEALDYAHHQGILHRDVKPSNLLLDVRGTVWVTDFGLAKVDDQPNLTDTGDILGTLRYMPPEAFEGRTDARSDVYALGLTLYELLAFRPAYDETSRPKLIQQVTTTEPPRLRKLNRHVPRDLETIVHKAIDREPKRRYATAGELAADLRRFLSDEPIRARRLSTVERVLKWSRRHKAVAALSSIAAIALISVAVVSFLDALSLQAQRDAVLEEQRRANAAEMKLVAARLEALFSAAPDSVPLILDLRTHKSVVLPELLKRSGQWETDPVKRRRVTVALAVLEQDRVAELCQEVEETPADRAAILTIGLQACDRAQAIAALDRRYRSTRSAAGRTRLAFALLTLGDPGAAQAELAIRADPSDRVRFIHDFPLWRGELARIPALLRSSDDSAFRSGVCLATGGVEPSTIAPEMRQSFEEVFAELYSTALDGATHSAAAWALTRYRGADVERGDTRVVAVPELPQTQDPIDGRRWFVNRLGMTMIAIDPGVFVPWSYQENVAWKPHAVVVTRPQFMLDQEVTSAWYRLFLASDDHPPGEPLTQGARQAELQRPIVQADWRSALLFCNWLSRREGRTPSYRFAGPKAVPTCDLDGNGYRLPTNAEWEYAFRCGSRTRFVTGSDIGRLLDYGRVFAVEAGPGKQFLPSPWGLFDQLGNDWEICWDLAPPGNKRINPEGATGEEYSMRGGSAVAGLYYMHGSSSFKRDVNHAQGFRVVCGPLQRDGLPQGRAATLAALNNCVGALPEDGRRMRADIYVQEGRWTEALADLRHALEFDRSDHLLWLQMAPLFLESGDVEGYRRHGRAMAEQFKDADEPWALQRTVRASLLLPVPTEEAALHVGLSQRALGEAPDSPKRSFFLLSAALAHYRQGNLTAAEALIDRGVNRNWTYQVALDLLHAMILHRRQQESAAHAALARACFRLEALDPSDLENHWHHALMCRVLRREAVGLLSHAVAQPPPPRYWQDRLALCHLALALAPAHPEPHVQLTRVLAIAPAPMRDREGAFKALQRGKESAPDPQAYKSVQGIVQYRLGRYQAAVTTLERRLRQAQGNQAGVDLFILALAHRRLGHEETARAYFDRAVRWADELGATLPPAQLLELRAVRAEAVEEGV